MTRYLAAVIAALLVALGASGWFNWQQAKTTGKLGQELVTAKDAADAAARSAKRANAAVLKARQEHAKAEAVAKAVSGAVEAAILAEPTWSSTPVPQTILEALNARPSTDLLPSIGGLHDSLAKPAAVGPVGTVPGPAADSEDKR